MDFSSLNLSSPFLYLSVFTSDSFCSGLGFCPVPWWWILWCCITVPSAARQFFSFLPFFSGALVWELRCWSGQLQAADLWRRQFKQLQRTELKTAAPQPLYSDELASSFFVPAFHSFWAGWEDGGEHYAVEPLLTILPLFGDHTWCYLWEAFFFVPVGGRSFVGKAH